MEKRIPVVKVDSIEEGVEVLTALENYGIHTAEITFRTAVALDVIKMAVKQFPKMTIGAGTVLNGKQCQDAIAAGATFIVSPGFSKEVAEVAKKHDILYIPGCVTPTEIMMALEEGLAIVKFFPADIYGGIKAIKALSSPFPQVKFLPTGGIDSSNMEEYLSLEAVIAVGGSSFVKEALKAQKK